MGNAAQVTSVTLLYFQDLRTRGTVSLYVTRLALVISLTAAEVIVTGEVTIETND